MRISINLASDPFRRDRATLVASAVLALALCVLMGVQVFLILSERDQAKETREAVGRLDRELQSMNAEQAKVEGTLRQPVNAEVLERSVLLNALVQRKSVSWTRVFADLESVMPYNVRLVQVRLPQVNSRNEVTLDMTVAAQEPSSIIGFLRKLEESPKFGPMTLHTTVPPSQNEPLYRSRVSVDYAQR
jgi:hypothetical protein